MAELGKLIFKKWNKDTKKFVKVMRKGKVCDIHGKLIDLFPIGVFAQAVDRTAHHVGVWIRNKELLLPMYRVPDKKTKYWFSRYQILNANHLFFLKYNGAKNQHFQKESFLRELNSIWYTEQFLPGVKEE